MKTCKDCQHAVPVSVKVGEEMKTVSYCHESPPTMAMVPTGKLMSMFPEIADDMFCSRWAKRTKKNPPPS